MAMPRCEGSASFTFAPSMNSSPEVMSSSPAMRRSSVDFPQPDGPTKTTKSPWAMSRSTSRITIMSPNAFPTFFSTTSATDASSNLSLPRR